MNNIDILEEELRKDILYQIDMQLYDEFNDKFCEIEENLGTVYSYKDLEDLKKAESDTERRLLRQAISTLIVENKEKDEEIKNQDKTIDRLIKEQEEREKYTHQLEAENKELNEKLEIKKNTPEWEYQYWEARKEVNNEWKLKIKEQIEIMCNELETINKKQLYEEKKVQIYALQSLLGKE